MKTNLNLVFGSSGLIGKNFKKINNKKKNYIFFSKNQNNFRKLDLNKSLKKFPYKEIDKCFFFASPRFLKKNFKKEKFFQEYKWLKNVILNIKINKLIYLSSSSIYYNKNNFIGLNKKKCEDLIIKNKRLFNYYQIWRPFNLVGRSYSNSDHFHNLLFKKMFIEKKKFAFSGNSMDRRGYSDVNAFIQTLYNFSKKNVSFIKDFCNKDLLTINEILRLYNLEYQKTNQKKFIAKFKSKTSNTNNIASKKNSIYYNKKSIFVLKKYLINSLNEKKYKIYNF